MSTKDFSTQHLAGTTKQLADDITNWLAAHLGGLPDNGGCKAFYDLSEWGKRGEYHGTNSELILCHDGGDLLYVCNLDYAPYSTYDAFVEFLHSKGYWMEQCTSWYSAVYKNA